MRLSLCVVLLCLAIVSRCSSQIIVDVADATEFKELLKLRNNVFLYFNFIPKTNSLFDENHQILEKAAESIEGVGTIAFIDCLSKEVKKVCKQLNGLPKEGQNFRIKHYWNGELNTEYDRIFKVATIDRFLRNPIAKYAPFIDDSSGAAIRHFNDAKTFEKFKEEAKLPIIVMFHSQHCERCRQMRPIFSNLQKEFSEKFVFVAVDISEEKNKKLVTAYNLEDVPSFIFIDGTDDIFFAGQWTQRAMTSWLNDPHSISTTIWSETQTDVHHLDESSFDKFIASHEHILIMFYAKNSKNQQKLMLDYEKAAETLKKFESISVLAAINCTKFSSFIDRYNVTVFPTLFYFFDGQFSWKINAKSENELVQYMQPPPEPWNWEKNSHVKVLTITTFLTEIEQYKYALVMFYVPWCKSCETTKYELIEAATNLKKTNSKVIIGVVDCSSDPDLCEEYITTRKISELVFYEKGKKHAIIPTDYKSSQIVNLLDRGLNADENLQQISPSEEDDTFNHESSLTFSDEVFTATPENFDAAVKKGRHLVMFVKDSCTSCLEEMATFEDVAAIVTKGGFVAVICTKHSKFCDKKGVSRFPTYYVYANGVFVKEHQGNSRDELLNGYAGTKPPPSLKFNQHVINANHLNFEEHIANARSLVLFYAPWCGHCKSIKSDFNKAAADNKKFKYIAVDCTLFRVICHQFAVNSFPALKVFEKGRVVANHNSRTLKSFVSVFSKSMAELTNSKASDFVFGKNVKIASAITFDRFVEFGRSIVMFYAPWCGHCKTAKPEFDNAATSYPGGNFIAIDCTVYGTLCGQHNIRSYPSFKVFEEGKLVDSHTGRRSASSFVELAKPKISVKVDPKNMKPKHSEL